MLNALVTVRETSNIKIPEIFATACVLQISKILFEKYSKFVEEDQKCKEHYKINCRFSRPLNPVQDDVSSKWNQNKQKDRMKTFSHSGLHFITCEIDRKPTTLNTIFKVPDNFTHVKWPRLQKFGIFYIFSWLIQ